MLVFEKDGGRKFIRETSSLIERLESQGWVLSAESETNEEKIKKVRKKLDEKNEVK